MGQGAAAIAQAPNPLLPRISTIIFLGLFVIGVVCASKDETPPPPPSTATRGADSRICLSNQCSTLLQFKQSLLVRPDVMSSWQHNGSDCCHWKGVTCSDLTGFVIALEMPFHDLGGMTAGIAVDSCLFKLRHLQRLDLSYNLLNGTISKRLVELTHLTHLNLSHCHFSGQIPVELSQMTQLVSLDLSDNLLTGKIPKSLLNCSFLRVLDLGNNKLNDSFPSQLGQLGMLQVLILRSNRLHGAITVDAPQQEFHWLKIFDISNNYFSGSLPLELFQGFKAMMSGTPENENEIVQINSAFLIIINLSNNNFIGRIPEDIGSLTALNILNISRNLLVGSIPESFGSLKHMGSLDLSYNQLSGVIPENLSALWCLEVLDLSYNDLRGMIPQEGMISTFPASSFERNRKLCGRQVNRVCSHAAGDGLVGVEYKELKEKGYWNYGSVEFGFAVGLVIATLPFLFMNRVTDWYCDRTDRMADFILRRVFHSRFGRRRHSAIRFSS